MLYSREGGGGLLSEGFLQMRFGEGGGGFLGGGAYYWNFTVA